MDAMVSGWSHPMQYHADTQVLRFITAGSVDDGKSTLIGRLLYDSKGLMSDQLHALRHSKYSRSGSDGTVDDAHNLALLTDGLQDEREQGITIDVAYRYFSTPRRKFIVADSPGHEQYTRNMVTAASTSDAAVILVDASKVCDQQQHGELLVQTRRHSTIAHLLGLRHIVVAVNKLDLLGWDQGVFEHIVQSYQALADRIGIAHFQAIPISALHGDNVVHASESTLWYRGKPLLAHLESLPVAQDLSQQPLRFPVQWVARHNGHQRNALRGYAGQIASGTLRVGDEVQVQPSGETARVQALLNFDGEQEAARAGQPITVVLEREVDISRGNWLTHIQDAPTVSNQFEAQLCWLDTRAASLSRRYLIKHGTQTSSARLQAVHTRRDWQKLEEIPATEAVLNANDIGRVSLKTRDLLAFDDYRQLAASGAFILIDEATHQTAAAGMIITI